MNGQQSGQHGARPAGPAGRARPVADPRGSVPERLNYLFTAVRPPGRRPLSAAEVARWINDTGGNISSVYISKILTGERRQPSASYLEQIARFFGVPLGTFLDENPPPLDVDELALRIAARNPRVQDLMARFLLLSPRSQDALSDIIDSLLAAEG